MKTIPTRTMLTALRRILLLFLACLLLTTLWAQAGQSRLADRIIRFHVLANSDSEADQRLKLRVRDAIQQEAMECLAPCKTREEAESALEKAIPLLTDLAEKEIRASGVDYPVRFSLDTAWYPTRTLGSSAIPAGKYRSFQVILGNGEGHNWWCVLFPSLCLPAVLETSVPAMGFTGEDWALISGETPAYRFQFRTVELWENLLHRLKSPCGEAESVID